MGDKLRFNDEDHGELYEPTDSEDNYSEEEKELLQKVRQGNRRKQDPKQELFAFDESDDDDDDNEEDDDDVGKLMADSDIEGAEDDDADLPDRRAWGSKSSNFYNTDFVDPDYSSYTDKEREMALAEEEEALAIQKRQALEMKEENFIFDMFPDTNPSAKDRIIDTDEETSENMTEQTISSKSKKVAGTGVIKLKMNLDGLSKREKLEIFDKDSPEFFGLVEDLEMGLKECGNLLTPVINYAKKHNLPNIPALEFAEVMNTLLTTYCSNINFYLMLKANHISIKTHPITNRLLELKDMHEQLSDKYENIIKPQLEALLERIEDGDVFEVLVPEQSAKKAISGKLITSSNQAENIDDLKLQLPSDDANTEDDVNAKAELANEEDERRSITYQISKNKGLTPHRKKELRNPRVKHRSKFRKALIRRKGAVRTVRTETKRYGGEVSGIKATVSKSVKFK